MSYRLYLDCELTDEQEESIKTANEILEQLRVAFHNDFGSISKIKYRLGKDSDTQKKNYLDKTESGHASHKKLDLF